MNHYTGEDCHYYFNGYCSRGEHCQYRHCEAALTSTELCVQWAAGCCLEPLCPYRHTNNLVRERSGTPCYWEHQTGGCRRPQCPFQHSKPRDHRGTILSEEERLASVTSPPPELVMPMASEEETVAMLYTSPPPALLPQDAGVDSPRVQQLVINPNEEESDGDSVQGTPVKSAANQRLQDLKVPLRSAARNLNLNAPETHGPDTGRNDGKTTLVDTSQPAADSSDLNFSVKSLDEIRQDKLARAKRLIEEADSLLSLEQATDAMRETVKTFLESDTAPQAVKPAAKKKVRTPPARKHAVKTAPVPARQPHASDSKPAPRVVRKLQSNDTRTAPPSSDANSGSSVARKPQSNDTKTVIKLSAKPSTTEGSGEEAGVKSLEEVLREKALASMRAAQEKRRLEAEKTAEADKSKSESNVNKNNQQIRSQPRGTIKQSRDRKEMARDRKETARDRNETARDRNETARDRREVTRDSSVGDIRSAVRGREERQEDQRNVLAARRVVAKGDTTAPRCGEGTRRTIKSRLGTREENQPNTTAAKPSTKPGAQRQQQGGTAAKTSIKARLGLMNARGRQVLSDVSRRLSGGQDKEETSSKLNSKNKSALEAKRRELERLLRELDEQEGSEDQDADSRGAGSEAEQGHSDEESDVSLRSDDSLLLSDAERDRRSGGESEQDRQSDGDSEEERQSEEKSESEGESEQERQNEGESEEEVQEDVRKLERVDNVPLKRAAVKSTVTNSLDVVRTLKRRVQRKDSDDTPPSPPKKRAVDSTVKKPFRRVFVEQKASTTEDDESPVKKKTIKLSAKSRLGTKKPMQITRTINISDATESDDVMKKEEVSVETGSVAGNKKRRLLRTGDAKARRREPRLQLYRPPAAQKAGGEEQRRSSPVLFTGTGTHKLEREEDEMESPEQKTQTKKVIVPVKTFAEIMREKQLRKEQNQENVDSSSRVTKRSISPVGITIDEDKPVVKVAKQSTLDLSNKPLETAPNEGTKRKVRRTVWSTRDTSSNPSQQPTRKLNITRNISDRDLGAYSDSADQHLFKGEPVERDLFTKKTGMAHQAGSTLASRLGVKQSTKGRSPFLRNNDDATQTTDLSEVRTESVKVPISPIVIKSNRSKISLSKSITPIGVRKNITPIGVRTERKSALAKQITPIGIKTEPKSKQQSTEWKRPDFLSVKIPTAQASAPTSTDAKLKSPGLRAASISPKTTVPDRRRSDGSGGRRPSTASKSEKDLDLDAELLLDDFVMEDGMDISVPDDDALLMEMQELLA